MPSLPIYQQQSSAGGALQARANPDDFGAGIDQAGQRVAGALGQAADAGLAIRAKEESDQNRVWVGSAATDFHLKQQQALQDTVQQANATVAGGGAVPDFTNDFLKQYKEKAQAVIAMAPNAEAKRYLDQQLTQSMGALGSSAIAAQGTLTRQWKVSTADTTVNNAAKIVQASPGQFDAQLANVKSTLPNIDPAYDAQHLERATATLADAAAGSALLKDPYTLRTATGMAMGEEGHTGPTGNVFVDAMTPQQVRQWNNAADVKIKQDLAASKLKADGDLKLAVDTVDKLRTFVTDGQAPDPQYQNSVRLLTKGTPWEAEANSLIEAGVKGAGFGAQSLPQQAAILQSTEGQPTDPETAKQLAHARAIFTTQTAAYKDDPWGAAARYQRLPPVDPVDITSASQFGQILQQRVPMMRMVEVASGQPAPLLRPSEVPQAITTLNAMPPAARARTLGQIGAALSPDQINAFAEQIKKGDRTLELSLRLGADQTVSGRMASEFVLLGAQGIKDKTIKADDAVQSGWRASLAPKVRGALGDAQAEQDVLDAAFYVRAAATDSGNVASGYQMTQDEDSALRIVIGSPLTRAGVKTFTPRGMTEDAFDSALQSQGVQQIKGAGKLYAGGREIPAAALTDNITSTGLRRTGSGRYIPVINGRMVTTDAAGTTPFSIGVQ